MERIERSRPDRTLRDEPRQSYYRRDHTSPPPHPTLYPHTQSNDSTRDPLNAGAPPPSGDVLSLISRREVLILTGSLFLPAPAAARPHDPFQDDARLRQSLTVRLSGMPLAELFQRLGAVLDVRLFAEGEDVADQKITLVARELSATEILTAITGLLNSEGPRGYWWERLGPGPRYRYTLVRDLASRQWEARRAAETEVRLVSVLRDRLRALRSEPFKPSPDRPRELPAMRKLLSSLSEAQLAQLASERFLILKPFWDAEPSSLWKELSEQALARERRRDPERVQGKIAGFSPADVVARTRVQIRLYGDPVRYRLLMAVGTPAGDSGMADICQFSDPLALGESSQPPAPLPRGVRAVTDTRQAAFALTPRTSWLMGDVLADLAARANVNLIADDYTLDWSGSDGTSFPSGLARLQAPQPLSVWLTTIQNEFGFAAAQDGSFIRLRNRRWWLDRGREVPERLLARWAKLTGGTPDDRIQAAVEIARWAPFFPGSSPRYRLHLGRLADRPEMGELSTQFTDPDLDEVAPGFTEVVGDLQAEFRIYALLSPAQQQAVRGRVLAASGRPQRMVSPAARPGPTLVKAEDIDSIIRQQVQREQGLTLSWQDMPSEVRDLFARRIRTFWEPGIDDEHLRRSSLWLRFSNDNILVRYLIAGVPHDRAPNTAGQGFIHRFAPARPVRAMTLVGSPAPELQYEDQSGRQISLHPRGPLMLYVAPAWPRPVVAKQEEFADLRAVQHMSEGDGAAGRVLVLGTDATAAELRDWWNERGLALPPLTLSAESARQLRVRHLPVAVVVDRAGRITWAKEGYTEGDETEWRRELRACGD